MYGIEALGPFRIIALGQLAVDGTAAVAVPTTALAFRSRVHVRNAGAQTVYLGATNGVTNANGFPLPSGEAVDLDVGPNVALFARCAAGQSTTLGIYEGAR